MHHARQGYRFGSLTAIWRSPKGGQNLVAAGYAKLTSFDCGSIDIFDNVPQRDQTLTGCGFVIV